MFFFISPVIPPLKNQQGWLYLLKRCVWQSLPWWNTTHQAVLQQIHLLVYIHVNGHWPNIPTELPAGEEVAQTSIQYIGEADGNCPTKRRSVWSRKKMTAMGLLLNSPGRCQPNYGMPKGSLFLTYVQQFWSIPPPRDLTCRSPFSAGAAVAPARCTWGYGYNGFATATICPRVEDDMPGKKVSRTHKGRNTLWLEPSMKRPSPYHPCMVYLPTFSWILW